MPLSDLPNSGSANFESTVRNTIHNYRDAIELKAANTHTHGTYGGVSLSLVAREANLGVGATGGELSSTTQEYHNMYSWDANGSLWQPWSGNLYSSVSLPTMGTYQNVTGTVVFDLTSSVEKKWNGSVWAAMILDEDDMTSNSATSAASQQSIKAYVDSQAAAFAFLMGG